MIYFKKCKNIKVSGIDHNDYPDYCDAYISYAEYKGEALTEKELEKLNEDTDFVYECVLNQIF